MLDFDKVSVSVDGRELFKDVSFSLPKVRCDTVRTVLPLPGSWHPSFAAADRLDAISPLSRASNVHPQRRH